MTFITMMVARLAGGSGTQLVIYWTDANITLQMVVYAFFLICIVQIIGICYNDNSLMQDFLFALCGFALYLSIGIKTVVLFGGHNSATEEKALASMCIITSIAYLVEFVLLILKLKES